MARKRMISPQIWEDPSFNKLSIQARLLFVGMFSNADDEGYLRADAGGLKRLVFGFDEIKQDEIVMWRGELTNNIKNMHFFENNGEEYAHFLNWNKFQKLQKDRIQSSVYPKCSICIASVKQVPTKDRIGKDRIDNEAKASDERKDLQIIKIFAKQKEIKELTQPFIKRNLRPAKELQDYSLERIEEVSSWLAKNADFKWTIETIGKYIDEDLSKIKSKYKQDDWRD